MLDGGSVNTDAVDGERLDIRLRPRTNCCNGELVRLCRGGARSRGWVREVDGYLLEKWTSGCKGQEGRKDKTT